MQNMYYNLVILVLLNVFCLVLLVQTLNCGKIDNYTPV